MKQVRIFKKHQTTELEKAIQTKNKNRTENINLEEEANEAIKRY